MEPKFKIGDRVRCIRANRIDGSDPAPYRGAGWVDERVFVIDRITAGSLYPRNGAWVYFPSIGGAGVYERFLVKCPWSFKEALKEKLENRRTNA